MAENTINVKVKQRTDTESNWASKNPVLLKGEMAISSDKNNKYKIGDGTSAWSILSYAKADLSKSDVTTALGYTPPTTNTTYNDVTQSAHGLMTAADKKKLDGIASGATKVTDSTVAGWGYKKTDTNTWRPVETTLTNENLNNVTTAGFYSAGGGNTVVNKPNGVEHFGMIVVHRASGSYYVQILFNDSVSWRRFCINGTWGSWSQDKFTDTNTWRPLGTTADTACAGNDSRLSNARPASDVSAWAKASSKPSYSWSEIGNKPSTFAPSSHNHNLITRADHLDTVAKVNAFIEANTLKYGTIAALDGLDGLAKNDGIILSASWKDSTNYGHQMYLNDDGYTIAHRYRNSGTWSAWKQLIDSNNYTSYTVTKTGSGASGTWGINVTGNAATATNASKVNNHTVESNVPANAKFTDTTYNDATTSAHGLMTADMVTKLNGIAKNANNYVHPNTSGNKHIPAGGSTGQTLKWSAAGTCTWETPHRVAIAAKEPSGQLTNDEWLLEYT